MIKFLLLRTMLSLKLIISLLREKLLYFSTKRIKLIFPFSRSILIYIYIRNSFSKNPRAHKKLLLFLRRFAINGVGTNHFAVSHILYVHLIDGSPLLLVEQERSSSSQEGTISWSWTCRVPTSVVGPVRSQDLSRRINWNERVYATSVGVHMKHENPLAPRGVNNDFGCRHVFFYAASYVVRHIRMSTESRGANRTK